MDQVIVPRELLRQVVDDLMSIHPGNMTPMAEETWLKSTRSLITALEQPAVEPVRDKDPQGCWNVRCQLGRKCKNTAAPQAQQLTKAEPDNLKCKSVQKRLATLWGYVEAQQPTGWLRAIDEEMVSTHLGVADATDSYEDAKRKLNALICWHIDVSHDSRASCKQPQLLMDDEIERLRKDAARYRWMRSPITSYKAVTAMVEAVDSLCEEQMDAAIDAAMEY